MEAGITTVPVLETDDGGFLVRSEEILEKIGVADA